MTHSGQLNWIELWAKSRYFCLALEALLTVILLLVAARFPFAGSRWFLAIEGRLRILGQRKRLAVLFVMALALVGRAAVFVLIPIPAPTIHDEFSYLLAGQTFASGRLTNVPHPMWIHFESVHILQQPTYMSMYQPAQSFFLALGNKIANEPWAGVWLSAILLSGVLCWMLQAWLSPAYALLGGLLFVARWGVFSYWVNGYWGGAVPAIGGALVLGALPRLVRSGKTRHSCTLAFGLVLLATSRPYEGLIFSASASIAFLWWAVAHKRLRKIVRRNLVITMITILGFAFLFTLFYNFRVTGSALKLPYSADREEYGIAPLFLWQKLKPEPIYHSASLKRVYLAEVTLYRKGKEHFGVTEAFRKLKDFWLFYFGPLLSVPLLALLSERARRNDRRKLFLWLICGLLVGLLGEVWFYPHYAAPATCICIALLMQGLRTLRHSKWREHAAGLFLARTVPLACALLAIIPVSAAFAGLPLGYWPLQWYGGNPGVVRPASIVAPLLAKNEKILVFVRYGPTHEVGEEWVYNDADIDAAPVVWARGIDPRSDEQLVQYFRDRKAYVIEPDKHPWVLLPYRSPLRPSNSIQQP